MIIVSDTTPLISLLKIDQFDLLKLLFKEIFIPQAVFDEMVANPNYKSEIEKFASADFIKIVPAKNQKTVFLIQNLSGLDLGESEAIALATELDCDFLLMDEAKGRIVAKQLGLKITGTIGILLEGFKRKLLTQTQIKKCVEDLKNSKRFFSENLFEYLLKAIEE